MPSNFSTIPDALADIRQGKMIILVDNPDRENEGDLFIPADYATPDTVNFMLHNARGLVCVAIDMQQAQRLALSPWSHYISIMSLRKLTLPCQ